MSKIASTRTTTRDRAVAKAQSYIISHLLANPCVRCGESNILTLEFNHVNPSTKKYSIANMISQAMSLKTIKKELDKCEVLCSNCHKIHTAKQINNYKYKYLQG